MNLTKKNKEHLVSQINLFLQHANKNNLNVNELSYADLKDQLRSEAKSVLDPTNSSWIWIEDVFQNYFIIEWGRHIISHGLLCK